MMARALSCQMTVYVISGCHPFPETRLYLTSLEQTRLHLYLMIQEGVRGAGVLVGFHRRRRVAVLLRGMLDDLSFGS